MESYRADQVKRMNRTYLMISGALERGALTPRSALSWAARAGRGEDVSVIAALSGSPSTERANRRVQAHSNSQLAQQILALLGQAVDGAPDPSDDEFAGLFPVTQTTTLVYDPPDEHGNRPAPHTVPSVEETSTDNRYTPYASSRFDGRPGTMGQLGEIDDEQADSLYPQSGMTGAQAAQQQSIEQQEQRERERAIRAGALDPYSDEDLAALLFGER